MALYEDEVPQLPGFGRVRQLYPLIGLAAVLLIFVGWAVPAGAGLLIEYHWWKEIGQVGTWLTMLWYNSGPVAGATVVAAAALLIAHARGLHFAGVNTREHRFYRWLMPIALAGVGYIVAVTAIDGQTVMLFIGSRGVAPAPGSWTDPVFGRPLLFYLFRVPFYSQVLGFVFALAILCALVFWAAARGWQLLETYRFQLERIRSRRPAPFELSAGTLLLPGAGRTRFLRLVGVIVLLGLAALFFLNNYDLLFNVHPFMVGADYVDQKIALPLRWALILATLAAIPLVWTARYRKALYLVGAFFVLQLVVPPVVRAVYVRPNEISIERPYIERHIDATTRAFALDRRTSEQPFVSSGQPVANAAENTELLQNIRLWDLRAYNATIGQIQALRPYYRFPDTDVDRYELGGRLRQLLVSGREIDVSQLSAEASQSWINPRFIYTHGFGAVVSAVNEITPDGLPVLLIKDAPPVITAPGLELTRPEIYYGEETQDPVFVHTARQEFNYPAGDDNNYSTYQGSGGFPVGSAVLKLAAAISEGEPNILFTSYLTGESRMMIHRKVQDRLAHIAPFLLWDPDPYLVITDDGRLVWMVDGYTTSQSHPYAATMPVDGVEDGANYIRNAVKATVDAYTGEVALYVFDPDDPIIQVYQRVFPRLFLPASAMSADLRRHTRYPEVLFRAQAEAYRTFHMRDPQVFYNKEDVWDVARNQYSQSGQPEPVQPTYIVATLPGERQPEFLLVLPFTPRGKDNLIGWMAARCDGSHLGEVVFYQLSKQQLTFGPMQIESRIDQDQEISKDLTLWNQQGSHVLRGNMIALPVDGGFLYTESIYLQATEARMPQLKKVVVAMGDRLTYADTFNQALAELFGAAPPQPAPATSVAASSPASASPAAPSSPAATGAPDVRAISDRLQQLHDQAEALAKELEALQKQTQAQQKK